jgi:S1-C subfamily serine protease
MSPLLLAAALSCAASAADPRGEHVVTLLVTAQSWDPGQPWVKGPPGGRGGSATVVPTPAGPRLLTSASMVTDATHVRVVKGGSSEEVPVRVDTVDREQNLALLAVDAPGFFEDLRPARLARRPLTEGEVTLVRWRGSQLESAEGRLSRPTVIDSATGVVDMVALRVNSGLSGGGAGEPAFRGKELVGVAFGKLGEELSVVPAEHLRAWIGQVQAGGAPWSGMLGLSTQSLRNPALVTWLGLDRARGVLVTQVPRGSSACGVLRRGDVLLSLDGLPLDADGNAPHPVYGPLYHEQLLALKRDGERVPIEVWREGQVQALELPLRAFTGAHLRVPEDLDQPPSYLMAGGLIFRELGDGHPARSPELRVEAALGPMDPDDPGRRVVVLAGVLPDPYNLGYHGRGDLPVVRVNGQLVDGLDDVAAALRAPQGGFHVIDLRPSQGPFEVVLDAEGLDAATRRIAAAYGLPEVQRLGPPPPPVGPPCEAPPAG